MTRGKYIGSSAQFWGKTASVLDASTRRPVTADTKIIVAQFDEGPLWMTNSWLTFERKDWNIATL